MKAGMSPYDLHSVSMTLKTQQKRNKFNFFGRLYRCICDIELHSQSASQPKDESGFNNIL